MAVITLKVEPGGCGAEKAMPARARTSPVRASSAAIPPKRPARASTAAACTAGVDRGAHRVPPGAARSWPARGRRRGAVRREFPPPGSRTRARAPRARSACRPGSRERRATRGRPGSAPGRPCRRSTRPRCRAASCGRPPGPRRSSCRRGRRSRHGAARSSAAGAAGRGRSPGKARFGAQPTWPLFTRSRRSACTVPKMRVLTVIGTLKRPEPRSCGLPASIRWAVAVVALERVVAA